MYISLEQQASVLSMEAFNLRASVQSLTKVLPEYVSKITKSINEYLANDATQIPLVTASNLKAVTANINLVVMRKVPLHGPAGLKVTYLEYLAAISEAVKLASSVYQGQLVPFNRWVGSLLGNPHELSSVSGSASPLKFTEKDIDQAKKSLEKCISPNNPQVMHEYGKLVRQNSEWTTILERTNALVTQYMSVDRTMMMNEISATNEILEKLIIRMKEEPETYKASGINVSDLSKRCLTLARSVEYYSVVGYLLTELSNTVQMSMDSLKRMG